MKGESGEALNVVNGGHERLDETKQKGGLEQGVRCKGERCTGER